MRSDGGGPHRETVHLPVDFDGPICAKCIHVRPSKGDDLPANGHDWQCAGAERQVLAPAETNPITGEVHEARFAGRPLCKHRNGRGDCKDFDRSMAPLPVRRGPRG